MLIDIGVGNDFLNMTPKAKAKKTKIDKLDLIKIKNFCASKDTIDRVIKQHLEKKIAKHMSDEILSKIYKQLFKPITRDQITQLKMG